MTFQDVMLRLVAGVERVIVAVGKAFARSWGYDDVDMGGTMFRYPPEPERRRPVRRSELSGDASLDYLSGMTGSSPERRAGVDVWCVTAGCPSYGERVSPNHMHAPRKD